MGLSPILYIYYIYIYIYIDVLLTRLSVSVFSCVMGHKYYGAIGYADDISLIALFNALDCGYIRIYEVHVVCEEQEHVRL